MFLFQRADSITVIFEVQDSVNAPVSLYFLLTIRPRRLNDLNLLTIFGKRACRRRSAQAGNLSGDKRSALCLQPSVQIPRQNSVILHFVHTFKSVAESSLQGHLDHLIFVTKPTVPQANSHIF